MASFGVGGEFGVGGKHRMYCCLSAETSHFLLGKFDNGGRFDLRLPYADQVRFTFFGVEEVHFLN